MTPDQACARTARQQYGVLSRSQALTAGISSSGIGRRVAGGRWERVLPAVYRVAGAPETWEQRLLAACLHAGPGAVASHRAAAALWRMDGVRPGSVEITARRQVRSVGVIGHQFPLPPRHITSIGPIPVTDPARTLLDLGSVLSWEIVDQGLDDALRRGLTTLPRLWRRLRAEAERGRSGAGVLRGLLAVRDPASAPPESVLEARLALLLRRSGLPAPVAQYEIREARRRVARLDFAWPDHMVALEADGYRYHSGRAAWQRDLTRRNALTGRGWRVLHVTWEDLARHPERVAAAIRNALRSAPFS